MLLILGYGAVADFQNVKNVFQIPYKSNSNRKSLYMGRVRGDINMLNTVIKIFWLLCIAVSILSVGLIITRFYTTERWLMLLCGVITVYFLFDLFMNLIKFVFSS